MKPLIMSALAAAAMGSYAHAKPVKAIPSAAMPVSSAGALAAANDNARRKPSPENFVDAAQIYDYAPGAIFELYATPEFLSTILLEDGETLQTSAAGDTARWMVEAVSAAGAKDTRTLIMVKPVKPGLRTNIVLVTDRRTYLIEAISVANTNAQERAYSAQIAWRYTGRSDRPLGAARVPLDALNFDYAITAVRGKPRWRPARVFNDGLRTYIEFAPSIITTDAPPLFVISDEGAELVNYRVSDNRYVVDQLFDKAELRLGDKRPQVVRIERLKKKGEKR
ncbi:MAG: TrbG/VirB9 family P-type conjugative transfer protein [Caulobacterales bacterium]